jgi:hypothetical protein
MSKREAFVITQTLDWSRDFDDWYFISIDGRSVYIDEPHENNSCRTGQLVVLEQTDVPVRGQEHVEEPLGNYWKLVDGSES